jgi:hypothetical protein
MDGVTHRLVIAMQIAGDGVGMLSGCSSQQNLTLVFSYHVWYHITDLPAWICTSRQGFSGQDERSRAKDTVLIVKRNI